MTGIWGWSLVGRKGSQSERDPAGSMGRMYRLVRYGGGRGVSQGEKAEMTELRLPAQSPSRDLRLETMSLSPLQISPCGSWNFPNSL